MKKINFFFGKKILIFITAFLMLCSASSYARANQEDFVDSFTASYFEYPSVNAVLFNAGQRIRFSWATSISNRKSGEVITCEIWWLPDLRSCGDLLDEHIGCDSGKVYPGSLGTKVASGLPENGTNVDIPINIPSAEGVVTGVHAVKYYPGEVNSNNINLTLVCKSNINDKSWWEIFDEYAWDTKYVAVTLASQITDEMVCCGSADGTTSATAPITGLCDGGSSILPAVSLSGSNWIWECLTSHDISADPNVNCSAINPSAASFSCTCTLPANAAFYAGDDTGLSGNTPCTPPPSGNTGSKCEYYCTSGTTWNGSACVACTSNGCEAGICQGATCDNGCNSAAPGTKDCSKAPYGWKEVSP